jgi:hypothetical protein
MRIQFCARLLLIPALIVCQSDRGNGRELAAGPGTVITEIITPEADGATGNVRGIGKAMGFDGTYLYYAEYAGLILHRINVPPPGQSAAIGHIDIPIHGAPSGIMSISYDLRRNAFWAIGGDGVSMYLMDKAGNATLQYRVDPSTDRPGNCKPRGTLWMDGCSNEVKINYDGTDDSIWYAPDTTERIYHYQTIPDAFGTAQLTAQNPFVDVDVPPNDMFNVCGYSQVSGVAVGGADLFINVAGCAAYFEYSKGGLRVGAYPMQPPTSGDIECDDRSYNVAVIWAREGWNGHIYAYQQPTDHSCRFGGGL